MSLSVSDTAGICIEILFCTVLWMLGTEEKQPFVIALNTQSFNFELKQFFFLPQFNYFLKSENMSNILFSFQ